MTKVTATATVMATFRSPATGMAVATNRGLVHGHAPAHVRSVAASPANLKKAEVVSFFEKKI